jgi:hypothetical protein
VAVKSTPFQLLQAVSSMGSPGWLLAISHVTYSQVVEQHSFFPAQGQPNNYAYFTACLKRNLRVAISLDHSSEAFSRQLEQNPALLSCCSMLWWQGWSDSSFAAMAASRLQVCWTVHVLPRQTRTVQQLHTCNMCLHSRRLRTCCLLIF